MMKTNKHYNV